MDDSETDWVPTIAIQGATFRYGDRVYLNGRAMTVTSGSPKTRNGISSGCVKLKPCGPATSPAIGIRDPLEQGCAKLFDLLDSSGDGTLQEDEVDTIAFELGADNKTWWLSLLRQCIRRGSLGEITSSHLGEISLVEFTRELTQRFSGKDPVEARSTLNTIIERVEAALARKAQQNRT